MLGLINAHIGWHSEEGETPTLWKKFCPTKTQFYSEYVCVCILRGGVYEREAIYDAICTSSIRTECNLLTITLHQFF